MIPILRKDKDGKFTKKEQELKRQIQNHYIDESSHVIDNDNISKDGLGMKGNSQLARNFIDFINIYLRNRPTRPRSHVETSAEVGADERIGDSHLNSHQQANQTGCL